MPCVSDQLCVVVQNPLSLMFAAAAEATGGGVGASSFAATNLLPRTVSMRSSDEVSAAMRVLRLPNNIFERICIHRSKGASYHSEPMAAPLAADPTCGGRTPALIIASLAEPAQGKPRERFSELQHANAELTLCGDQALPEGATLAAPLTNAGTECERWHTTRSYTPARVYARLSPDACGIDSGGSLGRTLKRSASQAALAIEELDCECEWGHHHDHMMHGRKHVRLAAPAPARTVAVGELGSIFPPLTQSPGMHDSAVRQWLRSALPSLEECEAMLAELLSEPEGHEPETLAWVRVDAPHACSAVVSLSTCITLNMARLPVAMRLLDPGSVESGCPDVSGAGRAGAWLQKWNSSSLRLP